MHDLSDFKFTSSVRLQWAEMDAAQHLNNAMYFRYFEIARVEYFHKLDWFAQIPKTGIGPILSETYARFKRPLAYPDDLTIGAKVTSIEEDRFFMLYAVYSNQLKMIAAEGTGTIVAFDYKTQKKALLPNYIIEGIKNIENAQ